MSDQKDTISFVWNVHSYLNSYIRFSDAKAGVLLAIASTIVAYLFGLDRKAFDLADTSLFWVTTALATASFTFGFCVIIPRLFTADPRKEPVKAFWQTLGIQEFGRGNVYWGEIRSFSDAESYHQDVDQKDTNQLILQVTRHNFHLSSILKRKYWFLDNQSKLLFIAFLTIAVFCYRQS